MPRKRTPRPARRRGRPDSDNRLATAIQDAKESLASAQDAIQAADTKAGLALSVQVAGLGALVAGAITGQLATLPDGGLYRAAVLALTIALVLSGAVLFPRLARRRAQQARSGLYFGERWEADELADYLLTQPPEERLRALTRQRVANGRIATAKHLALRGSITATAVAVVLLVAAALT